MKCPICGQELRPGKKDPNYLLCYNCKKKFKVPSGKAKKEQEERTAPKYANIPPKHVREKREDEMRKAYDELLSIEDGKKKKKKAKAQPKPKAKEEVYDELVDDYDYEDEKVSKAPVIILGIAILVVAAAIVYMLMH